ncbi:cupin domain-containing protein [candidate division WS5 bacterium]|uniref:Cupin domain-containing protein n=1 Tax=candidate division WS5 bacterium TaxID=2093353 RepID=A0A419DA93_9BACT|nr:MAG: cupin domain-containing protein [candidate division WS5 bacterium]
MNFEVCRIKEGKIVIAHSNNNMSVGYLEINPNSELKKHNRPCTECLYQIKGVATMVLFDEKDSTKELILKEGEEIEIPLGKYHIHANRTSEPCVQMWKAKGDIREILDEIRKNSL